MSPQHKRIITFVSVSLCICLIIVAGFYFKGKEERVLTLQVLDIIDAEALGAVSTLSVNLANEGVSSIEPKFSVMRSVTPYFWNLVEGPQRLPGKSSAIYKIRTNITEALIPNGETFVVRVNDAKSNVFSVSGPRKVDLTDRPPILNPRFKYWLIDPSTKQRKPFQWGFLEIKGSGDTISISQETVKGLNGLKMSVLRDEVTDKHFWAVGHVGQEIQFPTSPVRLWVYPTFTYKGGTSPENVFGVEINDGSHLIWFVFSDKNEGTYDLPNHRIVVAKAPLNEWSYQEIDVSKVYRSVGYQMPEKLQFILIVGTNQTLSCTCTGYFANIAIDRK